MCNLADQIAVLKQWMLGDESAVEFLLMLRAAAHLWDDLIDGDKPIDQVEVNSVFTDLLLNLPVNQFYNAHITALHPLIVNSVMNWRIATDFERGGDESYLRIAFILRSSYADLVTQSAALIGGAEHGFNVGRAVRKIAHSEGWTTYLENLAAESQARANKESSCA
jgi:hypothetical protein